MKQKVIKELQKLLALCMEINEKTEHHIAFHVSLNEDWSAFSVDVYKNGVIELENNDCVADAEHINLPNINKCRQKLLKYKEDKHGN